MATNASLSQSPRLLDQVRGKIRLKHYSIRTEQAYVDWIKRFVLHFDKRHPAEMGAREVEVFLTHLALHGKVAAATQNQAKSALLFLYREVLEQDLPWLQNVEQAKAPKRLPVVFTPMEAQAVLSRLSGTHRLVADCCMGPGCASWRRCGFGLRTWSLRAARSSCARVRDSRTG